MLKKNSLNTISILKKATYSLVFTIIVSIFSFGVSLSSATAAQENEAVIYGVISDKDGMPLSGIKISAVGPDGFENQVATDVQGAWQIVTKATGAYEISIDENAPGHPPCLSMTLSISAINRIVSDSVNKIF